jgi:peptidase M23-like protein
MRGALLSVIVVALLSPTGGWGDEEGSETAALQQIYLESFPGQYKVLPNGAAISASLPWPISGKTLKDISLFWMVEDAVTPGVKKTCDRGSCNISGSGELHYPRHFGVDIAATSGTSVKPVKDGKVEYVGSWSEPKVPWGQFVVISHDKNTWISLYGHLDVDTKKIKAGVTVLTTTTIGTVKDLDPALTGDIDHLHFGIRAKSWASTDKASRWGYAPDCSQAATLEWVNPLDYLSRKYASILDDNAATNSGAWTCSTGVDFYYGTGFRYLKEGVSGSSKYTFKSVSAGEYKIYARWTPHENRTSKARFTITQGSKTTTVEKSQKTFPRGGWVHLATMRLTSYPDLTVAITNGSSTGILVTDAVLIEKQ